MRAQDGRFLDAFKALDILCKDCLSDSRGVSAYLEEMEKASTPFPSGWTEDYKELKRLRWLRNRIAHDENPPAAGEKDIEWLAAFRTRILQSRDPLAQREALRRKKNAGKKPRPSSNRKMSAASTEKRKGSGAGKLFLRLLLAFGLAILALFVLSRLFS